MRHRRFLRIAERRMKRRPMMHGRVIVRSETDSAKNAASPVHVAAWGSVTAPDGAGRVARDRTASYRRSPSRCRTTNNKDSHNAQGRARGISHSRRVCKAARIRRVWNAIRAPVLAAIRPIYFSQGDHSITARSLGIANCARVRVCVCVSTGYGSRVRNDGYYVYRIRVMERTVVRNAFDYVVKDVGVWRWRSMLLYKREMQNGFFVKLIWDSASQRSAPVPRNRVDVLTARKTAVNVARLDFSHAPNCDADEAERHPARGSSYLGARYNDVCPRLKGLRAGKRHVARFGLIYITMRY